MFWGYHHLGKHPRLWIPNPKKNGLQAAIATAAQLQKSSQGDGGCVQGVLPFEFESRFRFKRPWDLFLPVDLGGNGFGTS